MTLWFSAVTAARVFLTEFMIASLSIGFIVWRFIISASMPWDSKILAALIDSSTIIPEQKILISLPSFIFLDLNKSNCSEFSNISGAVFLSIRIYTGPLYSRIWGSIAFSWILSTGSKITMLGILLKTPISSTLICVPPLNSAVIPGSVPIIFTF